MKIISFGEIMLRLTPPDYLLIEQTDQLQMSYVGTGVNLLSSLSRFGHETAILTQVSDNTLGNATKAQMRKLGIGDQFIGSCGNHMGSFFVELGYGNRPTQVTYQNRLNSSFCTSGTTAADIAKAVKWADVVHICGITLSLTETTRESAINLAKQAYEAGKMVCFDFNYRPSLNQDNEKTQMKAYYEEILQYSQLVFGSARDLTALLDFKIDKTLDEKEQLYDLSKQFMKKYDISQFAGTIRAHKDAPTLSGFIVKDEKIHLTPPYELTILDRIGAGDAYASGVIHGYFKNWPTEKTATFATVNAVLAHSTFGDIPMATASQIEAYIENPTVNLVR